MRRFMQNRCLAYILALTLFASLAASLATPAGAVTVIRRGGNPSTGGSVSLGDPDVPGGTTLPGGGSITPRTSLQPTRKSTAGDGVTAWSEWVSRFRIMVAEWRVRFVR